MIIKLINKLRGIKYKSRDWLWNNRTMLVPVGTGIASTVWFIIEPSPEPIVLLSTAFLAAFVLEREKNETWYTVKIGVRYEICFRLDGSTHKERIKKIEQFIKEFDTVFKWSFVSKDGDGINRVVIETTEENKDKFLKLSHEYFCLYSVSMNNREIYERGIG